MVAYFEMNLIVYVILSLRMYSVVKGEEETSIKPYNCTKLLLDAGCDEGGHLIVENVCINSSYPPSKPPKFSTTVHVGFLNWPRILDIDEGLSAIKLRLDDAVFQWEDTRIKINFNQMKKQRCYRPQPSLTKPFTILNVPLENMCNSLIDENDHFKIWTPKQYRIEGFLSSQIDDTKNPLSINDIGIRLSDPFNKSNPLIAIRTSFIVTIECKFDYKNYPIDTQKCGLRFASDKLNRTYPILDDPYGICNKSNELYEQNGFHVSAACPNGSNAGVDFYFKRDFNTYLLQHYLPSAIIVLVSQSSFVIPLSATPGRISLVVTLFLALTNIFINEQVRISIIMNHSPKQIKIFIITFVKYCQFLI